MHWTFKFGNGVYTICKRIYIPIWWHNTLMHRCSPRVKCDWWTPDPPFQQNRQSKHRTRVSVCPNLQAATLQWTFTGYQHCWACSINTSLYAALMVSKPPIANPIVLSLSSTENQIIVELMSYHLAFESSEVDQYEVGTLPVSSHMTIRMCSTCRKAPSTTFGFIRGYINNMYAESITIASIHHN